MNKIMVVAIVSLLFTIQVYPKKIAVLNELNKPETFCMDDTQYYITEGSSIFIYSLKDHKFIRKFGEMGEGPREFKSTPAGYGLSIFPMRDNLLINSINKLSFFSKNGEFVMELKAPTGLYRPIGKKFVGLTFKAGADQSMAMTINLFNAKLEKEKEIYANKFLQHGTLLFPASSLLFEISNNCIFTGGEEDFIIKIFNSNGEHLSSITREYKKCKVTEEYKNGVFEAFKRNPQTRGMVDYLKQMIKFKEYFPAIQLFVVDNDKIYIWTHRKQQEKYEMFIFNINGKFIRQIYFPIRFIDVIQPYPYTIKNGILYQLIENEEDEVWELHASEIK